MPMENGFYKVDFCEIADWMINLEDPQLKIGLIASIEMSTLPFPGMKILGPDNTIYMVDHIETWESKPNYILCMVSKCESEENDNAKRIQL